MISQDLMQRIKAFLEDENSLPRLLAEGKSTEKYGIIEHIERQEKGRELLAEIPEEFELARLKTALNNALKVEDDLFNNQQSLLATYIKGLRAQFEYWRTNQP